MFERRVVLHFGITRKVTLCSVGATPPVTHGFCRLVPSTEFSAYFMMQAGHVAGALSN